LFRKCGVCDFLGVLFGASSHNGLLPRVLLEFGDFEAETHEVHFNFLNGLALVQTNLNATIARADAADVILLYDSADHVLATADLFEGAGLTVIRKISNNKIDHFHWNFAVIVVSKCTLSCGKGV
jgi:hypothetical protein